MPISPPLLKVILPLAPATSHSSDATAGLSDVEKTGNGIFKLVGSRIGHCRKMGGRVDVMSKCVDVDVCVLGDGDYWTGLNLDSSI